MFKYIFGKTMPEAWEKSMEVFEDDTVYRLVETDYDAEDTKPTKEYSLVLECKPFNEPRISKAIPGGIEDLALYTLEVVEGIHDNWIDMNDPQKWHYTYHDRFVKHFGVDQIEYVINELARDNGRSRRAQITVWDASIDTNEEHCPCLQRVHFRLHNCKLEMHCYMRSNDALKAAFMNMFAFTELQAKIANELTFLTKSIIVPGTYGHIVDSYHLYGSYENDYKKYLEIKNNRKPEERAYNTNDVQYYFDEVYNVYGKKSNKRN